MWWCQFIDWLKFETRPSSLLNFRTAYYHLKKRVCMDWVDRPQNFKSLYGILQLLRGYHLDNFPLKTLNLWVAFHLVTFQLKCLYFQFNHYKKLVPVLSRDGLSVSSVQTANMPKFSAECIAATARKPQIKLFVRFLKIKNSFLARFSFENSSPKGEWIE